MKKHNIWLLRFIFFVFSILVLSCFIIPINKKNNVFSYENKEILYPKINITCNNEVFELDKNYNKCESISKIQNKIVNGSFDDKKKILNFAIKNGFSPEESVKYVFPEIWNCYDKISKKYEKGIIPTKYEIIKNTGKIKTILSKNGIKIDKNAFFCDVFNKLNNFSNTYNFNINLFKTEENKPKLNNLKGSFSTNFKTSNNERKNNIKLALKSLDGIVIKPNETLSFNTTTGIRNEINGYKKAKIIQNGTFIDQYGGGVCQVSSTLYNACLFAGLEIVEVHGHSLPVSYVEPCFDAMVNSGSSDLIIKNNTSENIIIATSSLDDICLVNIYGIKNDYEIKRRSEKLDNIVSEEVIITDDYKKYGLNDPLEKGEEKIISFAKQGYKAVGYLDYYKDGKIVKKEQIRRNTYNPVKQVVLVG